MKEIAWVGDETYFNRKFNVRNGVYINQAENEKYVCLSRSDKMLGRRFDKVIMGSYPIEQYGYYQQLYDIITNTRMKQGEIGK